MGFIKRIASTSAKMTVENFERIKTLLEVKTTIEMGEIPSDQELLLTLVQISSLI